MRRRGFVLGTAALLISACGRTPAPASLVTGFPLNGGFEGGLGQWGTGYIEDSVRKYHAPEEGDLPYWVSPSRAATQSRLLLDKQVTHSGGAAARIEHDTPKKANHFGTIAQRVPVRAGTTYEVVCWTRCEPKRGLPEPEWFLTASREWEPKAGLPIVPDWKESRLRFTAHGPVTALELRFVVEAPGTYWIDDVALWEV